MGLFKKKPDPVTERARDLDLQIAALQAEIEKLAEAAATPARAPSGPSAPSRTARANGPNSNSPAGSSSGPGSASSAASTPNGSSTSSSSSAIPRFNSGPAAPRLRSTALPHRPFLTEAPATHEPIFEEVNQPQIKADSELPAVVPEQLGTRKSDFSSLWQRVARHFRGPVTSNPKLVNYLAAGSIQGLQPLRYEKRVARNRFIVFAVFLALALWGLIAMLFSRR
jgi:hypothetical protein